MLIYKIRQSDNQTHITHQKRDKCDLLSCVVGAREAGLSFSEAAKLPEFDEQQYLASVYTERYKKQKTFNEQ